MFGFNGANQCVKIIVEIARNQMVKDISKVVHAVGSAIIEY